MKKIILLLSLVILTVGCSSVNIKLPDNASPQLIKEFNQNINSKDGAVILLDTWLNSETDFNQQNNKIEYIDEYSDYYNLKLTTAIKIAGRQEGIIGYMYYRVSKDGKLYGYYYSK